MGRDPNVRAQMRQPDPANRDRGRLKVNAG
jgi:hypothetical protein